MMNESKKKHVVRIERERQGLSQFRLAAKAHVHPTTISALERGLAVSLGTAEKIADALGIDVQAVRS
jgi:transcriptional regulator with XRE-family HTH domain